MGWALLAGLVTVTGCRGGAATPETMARPGPSAPLLGGGRTSSLPFVTTLDFGLLQNTVVVRARLNGARGENVFIVDSGAPLTLSQAIVRRLNLPAGDPVNIAGPESEVRSVPTTRVGRIELGGIGFEDIGAVITPIEPPNPLACLSSDGLLGASLLHTAIWQLDFEAGRMTITNEIGRLDHVANAERIPFTWGDAAGSPRIEARINSTRGVSMLVDLGFNGSLAVPMELYERTGNVMTADMPEGHGVATATVLGHGTATTRIGFLQSLQIGTLVLERFPVLTGSTISDVHVGIDFLRHFVVTLDWMHGDLYLRRRAAPSALYPRYETYGFVPTLDRDVLVVGFLWRDSAAARLGMQLGDRVVEIGGRDVAQASFADLCELLATVGLFGRETAPIEVVVSRADGRHRLRLERESLVR